MIRFRFEIPDSCRCANLLSSNDGESELVIDLTFNSLYYGVQNKERMPVIQARVKAPGGKGTLYVSRVFDEDTERAAENGDLPVLIFIPGDKGFPGRIPEALCEKGPGSVINWETYRVFPEEARFAILVASESSIEWLAYDELEKRQARLVAA